MRNKIKEKIEKRKRRARRVRMKLQRGKSSALKRLTVFRSNKHIYAQLIDDEQKQTLVSAQDKEIKEKELENLMLKKKMSRKIALAFLVGKLIARKALKKEIKKITFDRRGYKYHGRVKALAEGAREGGLIF